MLARLGGGADGGIGGAETGVAGLALHRLEEETIVEGIGVEMPELPSVIAVVEQSMLVAAAAASPSSNPQRADRSS